VTLAYLVFAYFLEVTYSLLSWLMRENGQGELGFKKEKKIKEEKPERTFPSLMSFPRAATVSSKGTLGRSDLTSYTTLQ
jgi:hypothetical protein